VPHRYQEPVTVTVRELCRAADVTYGMLDGPERSVRLRVGGGHESAELPNTRRSAFYVDVSGITGDRSAAARRILEILAVELDCYEAGESLVASRLGEPLRNGRYVLRARGQTTGDAAVRVLREDGLTVTERASGMWLVEEEAGRCVWLDTGGTTRVCGYAARTLSRVREAEVEGKTVCALPSTFVYAVSLKVRHTCRRAAPSKIHSRGTGRMVPLLPIESKPDATAS
jgi:hypothetical protein